MATYEDDMSTVPAPDELVPEGTYHVRVAKIEEKVSENSGNPMLVFTFKIQDEGPAFGRQVAAFASLQKNALFTLKGIYKACGYTPGPEGHDPEKCLDSELYVKVQHEMRNGSPQLKLPPYGFKSLTDPKGR
jgi:Protein of unknown function (DUF669)